MVIYCLNILLLFRSPISTKGPKPWLLRPVTELGSELDKRFANVHVGAYRLTGNDKEPRLETARNVLLKVAEWDHPYQGPLLKFPTKPESLKNDFLYDFMTLPMWIIKGMSGGPIFKLKKNEKTRAYVEGVISWVETGNKGVYGFCPIEKDHSGFLIDAFMALSSDDNADWIKQEIQQKGGYYADFNGHGHIDPANQAPGEGYWFVRACAVQAGSSACIRG